MKYGVLKWAEAELQLYLVVSLDFFIQTIDHQVDYRLNEFQTGELLGSFSILLPIEQHGFLEVLNRVKTLDYHFKKTIVMSTLM